MGPSIIGFGSYQHIYDSGREGDMPIIGYIKRLADGKFSKPARVLLKETSNGPKRGLTIWHNGERMDARTELTAARDHK